MNKTVLALLLIAAGFRPADAQQCTVLCKPAVSASVDVVRSHILNAPEVRSLSDNRVHTLQGKSNTELQLFVDMPTQWRPVHLYASTQWLPTAEAGSNPFTQYSASETDNAGIRANLPSFSLGLQLYVLPSSRTNGWLGLAGYGADLFSKAQQPDDASDYTHKLDLGVFALLGLFNWTAAHAWVHNIKGVVTLDYVATGLPHAGDEIPNGKRVFIDSVHSPSLIAGLVFPLAPLDPR